MQMIPNSEWQWKTRNLQLKLLYGRMYIEHLLLAIEPLYPDISSKKNKHMKLEAIVHD